MSEQSLSVAPTQGRPEVRAAIARAAQATGVDFAYLLGQARLESSLDPGAKAATSSAAGLYQFTSATWLATLDKHGAEHGLNFTQSSERSQLLALRYNPDAAALMAAELATDNRDALAVTLGREPDAAELYMAHFLGAQGAGKFLTALAADPTQSAPALFPKPAEANRGVFYDRSGAPRSLGGVMELLRGKLALAMGNESSSFLPRAPLGVSGWTAPDSPSPVRGTGRPETGWGWEYSTGVEPPSLLLPNGEGLSGSPQTRPSMAATLVATFGDTSDAIPAHVRSAYGKLKAFGL